jgi:hypothetical protein
MDSEPTLVQAPAPVATQAVPDTAPAITTASKPDPAANEEDTSTNDFPHAEHPQNKQEGSEDKSVGPPAGIWSILTFKLTVAMTQESRGSLRGKKSIHDHVRFVPRQDHAQHLHSNRIRQIHTAVD